MRRLLVGVLSLIPVLYSLAFMGFVLHCVSSEDPLFMMSLFDWIFPIHMGMALLSMGLWGFYVVDAIRNPALDDNQRMLWGVLNGVAGWPAWAVYYVMHVR